MTLDYNVLEEVQIIGRAIAENTKEVKKVIECDCLICNFLRFFAYNPEGKARILRQTLNNCLEDNGTPADILAIGFEIGYKYKELLDKKKNA